LAEDDDDDDDDDVREVELSTGTVSGANEEVASSNVIADKNEEGG
jgi:hypothetical protein